MSILTIPGQQGAFRRDISLVRGQSFIERIYLESRSVDVLSTTPGAITTITTKTAHGLASSDRVNLRGVLGPIELTGNFSVTVTGPYVFTIPISTSAAGQEGALYVPLNLTGFEFRSEVRSKPEGLAKYRLGYADTVLNSTIVEIDNLEGVDCGDYVTISSAGIASAMVVAKTSSSIFGGASSVVLNQAATSTKVGAEVLRSNGVVAQFDVSLNPIAGLVTRSLTSADILGVPIQDTERINSLYYHDLFAITASSTIRFMYGECNVLSHFTKVN